LRHKNTPKFIDCNLKGQLLDFNNFWINIPDISIRQMTTYVPASPNFCFCATGGKQNNQNITFLLNALSLFDSHDTHLAHFDQIYSALANSFSNCPVVQLLTVNI